MSKDKNSEIKCLYCDGDKCSRLPRILGIFKRKCVYATDVPHFPCHLEIRSPDRDFLQGKGIVKW
jgi:hypothetical protein